MTNFKFRKKSGIIRPVSGGNYDCPDFGVKLLLDDVEEVIVSIMPYYGNIFFYKIESYPESHYIGGGNGNT